MDAPRPQHAGFVCRYQSLGQLWPLDRGAGGIVIWNVVTGGYTKTLVGHTTDIRVENNFPPTSVANARDGIQLIATWTNKTIKTWDATAANLTLTMDGRSDLASPSSVILSANGKQLTSTWISIKT
jgi:hypothetical protein